MKRVCFVTLLMPAIQALAVTGTFRPVNNTFVLSPGIASPMRDANDLNFGGSGSLCVSSPAARAYDPNLQIDHPPKGEFITLLKFAPVSCKGTSLTAMTLRLAITCGNQSANGIFNYLGGPGDFDLYWISNEWQQGYGTPSVIADSRVGITYTGLVSLLDHNSPCLFLETLHYDANHPYSAGEKGFTFDLDLSEPNYAGVLAAMENGEVVTFMLRASKDSLTCFNLRAYVQYNKNGTVTFRDTGPVLEVKAVLPDAAFDFNADEKLDSADLTYLLDHWQQTGQGLVGDIAPLGGDGVIDLLDVAEFIETRCGCVIPPSSE
jgi:hypothetical protein